MTSNRSLTVEDSLSLRSILIFLFSYRCYTKASVHLSIDIDERKWFNFGKNSVRRLLTIWTKISIDKDVEEGKSRTWLPLSEQFFMKLFDDGTLGMKDSKQSKQTIMKEFNHSFNLHSCSLIWLEQNSFSIFHSSYWHSSWRLFEENRFFQMHLTRFYPSR